MPDYPPIVINCHAHPHGENEVEEKRDLWASMNYRRTCVSGRDNELVARWVERYPDFVIGLWMLDEARGPEQMDEAHERGFRGAKVINTKLPYSHEAYFPFYQRCEALDAPILFHTGILALKNSRQENYAPIHLGTICGAFPKLKVIGAHFGLQWYWEAIMTARPYENLYYDLSGGTWRNFPITFFRHWFERVERNKVNDEPYMDWSLAEKLVFGSDNPDDTLEFYVNLLHGLGVPRDVQDRIYYLNACEIFGLKPEQL